MPAPIDQMMKRICAPVSFCAVDVVWEVGTTISSEAGGGVGAEVKLETLSPAVDTAVSEGILVVLEALCVGLVALFGMDCCSLRGATGVVIFV